MGSPAPWVPVVPLDHLVLQASQVKLVRVAIQDPQVAMVLLVLEEMLANADPMEKQVKKDLLDLMASLANRGHLDPLVPPGLEESVVHPVSPVMQAKRVKKVVVVQ